MTLAVTHTLGASGMIAPVGLQMPERPQRKEINMLRILFAKWICHRCWMALLGVGSRGHCGHCQCCPK